MKEVRGRAKKVGTTPAPGEVLYLDEPKELGAKLDVVSLAQVEMKMAAGGNFVEGREALRLDLLLQTAAGPLHVADVYCKIMEGHEEGFLLGTDTMVALGIDVNEQLSQLAAGLPTDKDHFESRVPEPMAQRKFAPSLKIWYTVLGN
ncbi:hypothetical protein PC128_g26572 [Phytophthora cactorum]|uniref:Uncharacterized protein n=1 Tax=Phytophthora cactorum TaxID=29920 RepID=A0A8T1AMS6_9STRA|nr:hypothetical protein PC117_g25444 [Phytophthora cactorum]KAG3131673.1 hypothetical protein PC128_g26572 [Phytophthora cactorum]